MNLLSTFARTLVLALLFSSSQTFAEAETVPESIAGTTRVTAEQVIDLLDEYDDLVIIDSRKPSDRSKGFIEDSIALPDFDTTAETLAKHIPTKDAAVVFYCNGEKCGRSVKASKIAVKEGYTTVFWFRGGWGEWTEKGYPVAK
ncbi:MAG: hypothetical protein JKX83_06405 [Pseudomonadales bacterium]|nr:hypothetical protein [Pseudomonadales bacterium]